MRTLSNTFATKGLPMFILWRECKSFFTITFENWHLIYEENRQCDTIWMEIILSFEENSTDSFISFIQTSCLLGKEGSKKIIKKKKIQ